MHSHYSQIIVAKLHAAAGRRGDAQRIVDTVIAKLIRSGWDELLSVAHKPLARLG